ncbi:AzlD domain-containing protein [Mesosutterella sp. AGMB02718]|uniref:AzlD domain-containing protein n=1 Tax=Mesosutterella faecium TaxID=2925194 RepID=A0ABT7INU6_9BURK|nr:AzlD domain-containing protein [Mesosutterella sp. AGMB02718]MDL2060050.1 AzlD domain-containing protein [Mesosutterella sp. AGMB02718]
MEITLLQLLTILGMAAATYSTRALSYLFLRGRGFSPDVKKLFEMMPCCVMVSVVAPSFMTTSIPDLGGLAAALLVAAKKSLILSVAAAVGVDALLMHVL